MLTLVSLVEMLADINDEKLSFEFIEFLLRIFDV